MGWGWGMKANVIPQWMNFEMEAGIQTTLGSFGKWRNRDLIFGWVLFSWFIVWGVFLSCFVHCCPPSPGPFPSIPVLVAGFPWLHCLFPVGTVHVAARNIFLKHCFYYVPPQMENLWWKSQTSHISPVDMLCLTMWCFKILWIYLQYWNEDLDKSLNFELFGGWKLAYLATLDLHFHIAIDWRRVASLLSYRAHVFQFTSVPTALLSTHLPSFAGECDLPGSSGQNLLFLSYGKT